MVMAYREIVLYLHYEKSRNENMRSMENPFKFGTIVEEEYFTDRVKEVVLSWNGFTDGVGTKQIVSRLYTDGYKKAGSNPSTLMEGLEPTHF